MSLMIIVYFRLFFTTFHALRIFLMSTFVDRCILLIVYFILLSFFRVSFLTHRKKVNKFDFLVRGNYDISLLKNRTVEKCQIVKNVLATMMITV